MAKSAKTPTPESGQQPPRPHGTNRCVAVSGSIFISLLVEFDSTLLLPVGSSRNLVASIQGRDFLRHLLLRPMSKKASPRRRYSATGLLHHLRAIDRDIPSQARVPAEPESVFPGTLKPTEYQRTLQTIIGRRSKCLRKSTTMSSAQASYTVTSLPLNAAKNPLRYRPDCGDLRDAAFFVSLSRPWRSERSTHDRSSCVAIFGHLHFILKPHGFNAPTTILISVFAEQSLRTIWRQRLRFSNSTCLRNGDLASQVEN